MFHFYYVNKEHIAYYYILRFFSNTQKFWFIEFRNFRILCQVDRHKLFFINFTSFPSTRFSYRFYETFTKSIQCTFYYHKQFLFVHRTLSNPGQYWLKESFISKNVKKLNSLFDDDSGVSALSMQNGKNTKYSTFSMLWLYGYCASFCFTFQSNRLLKKGAICDGVLEKWGNWNVLGNMS